MRILITAPSLDETVNVSGISTVVRQIIENGTHRYEHFTAGRTDGEPANASWIAKQIRLPFHFYRRLKNGKFAVAHINTALNPLSIARDYAFVKAAKFARTPILLHVHGGKFLAREFENKTLARLAEKMLDAANAILVLSELEKEIVEKRWQKLKSKAKVKVLENAVAIDETNEIKRSGEKKTIIFLGRFHESKGLHEIVEACRRLKNENLQFRFKAFGAGDLQNFFVGEMTKILGDDFYFGGVIAGKEKQKELAASDVFLLPSRYGEGLPMAMLEAMAAKCVVVASKMASIGAVVENNVNGLTVEPQNVAQIIEKLKLILSGEIDAKMIGENARRTIAEKYNLPGYIVKLEKIYAEIERENY